jgi:hypothetical protein
MMRTVIHNYDFVVTDGGIAKRVSSHTFRRGVDRLQLAAQTTLDPKLIKEWTPNSRYGGHAFGFGSFGEFLAGRDKILPWIAEYSPYALVNAGDPPVYRRCGRSRRSRSTAPAWEHRSPASHQTLYPVAPVPCSILPGSQPSGASRRSHQPRSGGCRSVRRSSKGRSLRRRHMPGSAFSRRAGAHAQVVRGRRRSLRRWHGKGRLQHHCVTLCANSTQSLQ